MSRPRCGLRAVALGIAGFEKASSGQCGLRAVALGLVTVATLLLSACQSVPEVRPLPPEVRIESVRVEKVSLDSQDLAFVLTLQNPNAYDLPLQYLSFIASLGGEDLAQGISNDPVRLPANGEAEMEVHISTRLNRLLGHLLLAARHGESHVAYDIRGVVKLSNWPTRIPFNVDGLVDNPVKR